MQALSITEHPCSHSFSCYSSFRSWKVTGVLLNSFWKLFRQAWVSLPFHNTDFPTFFSAHLRVLKWARITNSSLVPRTWYKTKQVIDKISFQQTLSLQQTLYHELQVCTEKKIPNQSKFSFKEAKISFHWEKFSCQMLVLQLWPSWLVSYLKQGCNDFFSLWQYFISLLMDS